MRCVPAVALTGPAAKLLQIQLPPCQARHRVSSTGRAWTDQKLDMQRQGLQGSE